VTLTCLYLVLRHGSTIINFDRILVLSAGKVVEFDTPANLLAKEDGVFAGMAKEAGLVASS